MNHDFDNYVNLAKAFVKSSPKRSAKHVSFIVKKNKILSVGLNNKVKTHPLTLKYNYKYNYIHSELNAITVYDGAPKDLKDCTLINIRLGRKGTPLISRPCKCCQKLIKAYGLKEVYFTNKSGKFEKFL